MAIVRRIRITAIIERYVLDILDKALRVNINCNVHASLSHTIGIALSNVHCIIAKVLSWVIEVFETLQILQKFFTDKAFKAIAAFLYR